MSCERDELSGFRRGGWPVRQRSCLAASVVLLLSCVAATAEDPAVDDPENDWLPGLSARYEGQGGAIQRVDHRLAFCLRPDESPHPLLGPDEWECVWTGVLDLRAPGRHHFAASVLGQFELTINDRVAVKADSGDSMTPLESERTAIDLPYGLTKITARFKKHAGRGALLRLVMQRPDGLWGPPSAAALWHSRSDDAEAHANWRAFDAGRAVVARKRCLACHLWDDDRSRRLSLDPLPEKPIEPRRWDRPPRGLPEWLANPRQSQPAADMPKLFRDRGSDRIDIAALAEYLSTLRSEVSETSPQARPAGTQVAPREAAGKPAGPEPKVAGDEAGNQARNEGTANGRAAFAAAGCIGCHPFFDEPPDASRDLWRLDAVSLRFTRAELIEFLCRSADRGSDGEPRAVHQPRLDLAPRDSRSVDAIVDYLQAPPARADSRDEKEDRAATPTDAEIQERIDELVGEAAERSALKSAPRAERLARLGQIIFRRRGCIQCHSANNQPAPKGLGPAFDEIIQAAGAKRAGESVETGCLAPTPAADCPDFALTADERTAVNAVLRTLSTTRAISNAPLDRLEISLVRQRCTVCHERGGAMPKIAQRFQQTNSLKRGVELWDILPPSLEGIGERLLAASIRAILIDGHRARPWLDLKMPFFEKAQVEPLIDCLIRAEGWEPGDDPEQLPAPNATALRGARELIGSSGLNCVGCHDYGEHKATGVRAPDLLAAPKRLHYAWFRRWLHDPQSLAPGTRMPSYFSSGRSALPQLLNGREDEQVAAIWGYLSRSDEPPPRLPQTAQGGNGGEAETPIPTDRPLLVHGFMPEHAGLRGIAIGHSRGTHFAFDGDRCALTRVWVGPFIRHEGWQGSGKNEPAHNGPAILGEIVWRDDSPEAPVRLLGVNEQENGDALRAAARLEESWAGRQDAGIAWRLNAPGGERIRIEERPEPAPRLGAVAFRRQLTVAGLPSRWGISLRVFSGGEPPEGAAVPTSVAEWMRIPQGGYDWLVRRTMPGGDETWRWTEPGPGAPGKPGQSLWLDLPAQAREGNLRIDLEYVRVRRGSEPPMVAAPTSQAGGT